VTIVADTLDEALGLDARKLAYEERFNHGFSDAGIEASGGAYPVTPDGKTPSTPAEVKALAGKTETLKYERVFKLTRAGV
jgi:hypothetical protein